MDLNTLNEINDLVNKYNAVLLPVVKGRKLEDIKKIYDLGFTDFGENRMEELLNHKKIFQNANFHFIAPLQSRKINEIMNNCVSIHTVSREKEAIKINKNYDNQNIFVQINVDNDPNKSGIKPQEVYKFFNIFKNLSYFPIGIMCIPSQENEPEISFSNMQKINENIKKNYQNYKGELSMGMSDDYKIALDYGATIIRIGSKIFR